MKVTLKPRAGADLEAIAGAASFVAELRAKCLAIAAAPLAYATRPDIHRDLRCCPHGSYLVFYRVLRSEVQILRVIHSARDVRYLARRGEVNEPQPAYEVSDFEALGFLRLPGHEFRAQ